MDKPTCSEKTALEQAGYTIKQYFKEAIEIIDKEFGNGYAKENPKLVGDMIKAMASDFNNCSQTAALYEIAQAVSDTACGFDIAQAIEYHAKTWKTLTADIYEDQRARK